MHMIVVADSGGVRPMSVPKLDLKTLYGFCCESTPGDEGVECIYDRFPDPKITIWCHHVGRLASLPVYAVLSHGEDFCGPLVVTGTRVTEDGEDDAGGLTAEQVRIVLDRLLPAVGIKATKASFRIIPLVGKTDVHDRH